MQEMAFAYKTEPKHLKAVIGPGISMENFEVGDEVYEAFEQAAFSMEEIAAQYPNAAFKANPEERERMAAEGNIDQPLNGTSICHFAIRRFLSIAVFWRKIFMIAAFVHLLILMNIFSPQTWN